MSKFKIGDRVIGVPFSTIFPPWPRTITQIAYVNGYHSWANARAIAKSICYRVNGSSHWFNEYKLQLLEPQCPICNVGVKIENNKISKHTNSNNQLCYGSFMPSERQ